MEPPQKDHIQKNLPELIKLTIWRSSLSADLIANGVLKNPDVEEIDKAATPSEKATQLYHLCSTRTNGYLPLQQALENDNQTGAVNILKRINSVRPEENTSITNEYSQEQDPVDERSSFLSDKIEQVPPRTKKWKNNLIMYLITFLIVLILSILVSVVIALAIAVHQIRYTSNENDHRVTLYITREPQVTERPETYYTTNGKGETCLIQTETINPTTVVVYTLSQYQALNNVSNQSVISLIIHITDKGEWLKDLPLLKQNQILFLSLQGDFCFELVKPLLQMAVCVTKLIFSINHYTSGNEIGQANTNNLNVKLPKLQHLTIKGNNVDSYNNLFSTISKVFQMDNLIALTIDDVVINEGNRVYIMKTLSNLLNLTYFQIGAKFETNEVIYNVSMPLKNLKSIVWNGYNEVNSFLHDDGNIYVGSDFCKTFPYIESFQNNIGFLDFKDKNYLWWCKDLKSLNLGLRFSEPILTDLQIVDFLPELNSLHLRLSFYEMLCPPYDDIQNLKIESLNTDYIKNATIHSNCAITLGGLTFISF